MAPADATELPATVFWQHWCLEERRPFKASSSHLPDCKDNFSICTFNYQLSKIHYYLNTPTKNKNKNLRRTNLENVETCQAFLQCALFELVLGFLVAPLGFKAKSNEEILTSHQFCLFTLPRA